MKLLIPLILLVILFSIVLIYYLPSANIRYQTKPTKTEIMTNVKGPIIEYNQKFYYSKKEFSKISKDPEFKTKLIDDFKSKAIGVTAKNCTVKLNNNSALLSCYIIGAMYAPNQYSMHWLLHGTKMFGFDLYGFKQENDTLIYNGMINGIQTKIILKFPYVINHCHEHVWPKA